MAKRAKKPEPVPFAGKEGRTRTPSASQVRRDAHAAEMRAEWEERRKHRAAVEDPHARQARKVRTAWTPGEAVEELDGRHVADFLKAVISTTGDEQRIRPALDAIAEYGLDKGRVGGRLKALMKHVEKPDERTYDRFVMRLENGEPSLVEREVERLKKADCALAAADAEVEAHESAKPRRSIRVGATLKYACQRIVHHYDIDGLSFDKVVQGLYDAFRKRTK